LSASDDATVTSARARSTPACLRTSSDVASPGRAMPWSMWKSRSASSLRSRITNAKPCLENSWHTNRPIRPKPQMIMWFFNSASRLSMRCLPRTSWTSPLTTDRTTSVAVKKIVNTPPNSRKIVNTRPAFDSSCVSA